MKRSALVFPCVAVVLALVAVVLVGPFGAPRTRAASSLQFESTFATPSDFYDRFDYGYSGFNPYEWGTSPAVTGVTHWMGDHNMGCAAPTTQRDVSLGGDSSKLDYSQVFWHCQPGGDPAKGHLMTSVNTEAYNIAWFSPKQVFSGVSKVCWDINETDMSDRKWTQVVFVDEADAHRYPVTVGTEDPGAFGFTPYRAASGGFDLGFPSPEFSVPGGPTTNVVSGGVDGAHQTLAGFVSVIGLVPEWFQAGQFTTPVWGGSNGEQIRGLTDKAARYKHCLENQPNGTVRLTQALPTGSRVIDLPGQIPQGAMRVVFQDDNYNPPKADTYDPNVLTWHWDNIQLYADSAVLEAETVTPSTAPSADAPSTSPSAADEVAGASSSGSSTGNGLGMLVVLSCAVLGVAALALVVGLRRAGVVGGGGSSSGGARRGDPSPPPPSGES